MILSQEKSSTGELVIVSTIDEGIRVLRYMPKGEEDVEALLCTAEGPSTAKASLLKSCASVLHQ